jgi:hypothetical protein
MTSLTGFPSNRTGASSRGYSTGDNLPKGYRAGQIQQYEPREMQLYNQLRGLAAPNSYLSRLAGGDEEIFKQIEGPQMRNYQEMLGNIGAKFSGIGTGGRHSSGFQNTVTSAASNFAQDLAANRQGLQRQAMQDLQDLIDQLLGRNKPYERFAVEKRKKQNPWGDIGGQFANQLPTLLAGLI